MRECQCSLSASLTGDGCRYCQPQTHIDKLKECLKEERDENAALIAERDALQARIDGESWPCRMVAADWLEKTATIEFDTDEFKAFAGKYYLVMVKPELSGNSVQVEQ
jgi:hypothetical protein